MTHSSSSSSFSRTCSSSAARRSAAAARASFPFDARSALLFAALAVGGIAASQAQPVTGNTTGTAPAIRSTPATPPGGRATFGGTATQSAAPAAGTAATATPPSAQDVDVVFNRNDTDKDGQLSPQEAQALPAVAQRFSAIDTNKDKRISKGEFTAAVSRS